MKKIFSLLALSLALSANDLMHDELNKSMHKMHKDMDYGIKQKDADLAFVAGMLPHHIGAVEMAQIELKYGKDEELKKLAKQIIKAQEAEIKFMQAYLDKKGFKYPKDEPKKHEPKHDPKHEHKHDPKHEPKHDPKHEPKHEPKHKVEE